MAGEEDRGDGEPVSLVTVRVQYLEDTDPFACANFPEPRRAPTCSLDGALPLGAQIPALHRLLGAPLKAALRNEAHLGRRSGSAPCPPAVHGG
ncbi:FHOD1 [Cervus elaphus hippelaphus]|uniref:FHOD1 n=1 Tax=Cervus elaphus hippelaphus TaxID=46360 RepID=A0A212DE70_CEREH|nr:FHOD1 [Cervus elaphus hippelaphus]